MTTLHQYGDHFGSAGSTITVLLDGVAASLFADAEGTIPLPNPLTASANRFVNFFAAPGTYVLNEGGHGTDKRTVTLEAPPAPSGGGGVSTLQRVFAYSLTMTGGGIGTGLTELIPTIGDELSIVDVHSAINFDLDHPDGVYLMGGIAVGAHGVYFIQSTVAYYSGITFTGPPSLGIYVLDATGNISPNVVSPIGAPFVPTVSAAGVASGASALVDTMYHLDVGDVIVPFVTSPGDEAAMGAVTISVVKVVALA
jgi:hypothetical protein